MNIQHKIVYVDKVRGAITVSYFTDAVPEGLVYQLDLPVIPVFDTPTDPTVAPTQVGVTTLSGQALEDFIIAHNPTQQLEWEQERRAAVKGIDLSHIDDLVVAPVQVTAPTTPTTQGMQTL
jgi:hypothetical protein